MQMKWEDYNRMSKRQKEEYNYRFKNHLIVIDVRGLVFVVMIFYLLMNVMLFISYIVITDEKFEAYNDSVIDILASSSQLMLTGTIVLILIAIINLINILIWSYKEKKWIRENNIRITHTNRLIYVIKKMFKSKR